MVRTETFEDRVLLTQTVAPNPVSQSVGASDAADFAVNYTTDDDTLTGLTLRMHFDSSKFTFDDENNIQVNEVATNFFPTGLSATQVIDDTANQDNDAATDKTLLILYFEIGGNWPGPSTVQPLKLYDSALVTNSGFTAGTAINFSASPAAGQTFQSTSANINFLQTPPNVGIANASPVTEGSPAVFDVTINRALDVGEQVVVTYNTADGSATSGDYTAATGGTLTFNSGDPTTKTISVATVNDDIPENDETFTVNITATGVTNVSPASATGTIQDTPDFPVATITDSVTVNEGDDAVFTVSLNHPPISTVSISFATADGTTNPATETADYTGQTGTLTFNPGVQTQTITIATEDDTLEELGANETFLVNLTSATGATIGDPSSGTGSIDDNDSETLLHGRKFNDLNANGVRDSGESYLNGWTIELVNDQNTVVDTAVTMDMDLDNSGTIDPETERGWFWLTTDVAGDFTVREVLEAGWVQSAPATGEYSLTVGLGEIVNDLDFGNYLPSSITGIKFHDRNLNGVQDNGEEGLEGWEIILTDTVSNTTFATATTEADGTYLFADVPSGSYAATETLQVGWVQSSPLNTLSQKAFDLDQSLNLFTSGNEFEDWGGLGEKWVQGDGGWYYITPDGSLFQWNGSPRNQLTGEFVEQLTPAIHENLNLLYDAVSPNGHVFDLTSGEQLTGIDFGNYQLGSIFGRKFGDLDENGARDEGEPWLAGWTIQLLDLNGNVLQSDVTDGEGQYSFNGLTPHDYLVREVPQQGFRQTFPEIDPNIVLAEQAFLLDQERSFFGTANDFINWGGRNEKWFQSASGYHFVTPSGKIFEWDSSPRNALTGVLVGELDNSYYEDPTLIYDAQFPGGTPITVGSGDAIMQSFGNAEVRGGIGGDADYGHGNVTAQVSHGDLIINGDGIDNGVRVFLNEDGHIVVQGLGTTTINGSNQLFVAFESTNWIPDDLRIDMDGGYNLLVLQDFHVNDDLRIVSDGGNDYLLIDNVNVGDDLYIDSNKGDDIIGLNKVQVADRTTIYSDDGHDVVAAIASLLQNHARIRTYGGADMVYSNDTRFNHTLDVDLDGGNDFLAALNSHVGGEAQLDGDRDFDSLLFDSQSTAGELDVEDFESDTINDLQAQIDAVLERLALRGIEFSFDSDGNIADN